MFDAKTKQFLTSVRGRHQVELSVRLAPDAIRAPAGRPDQFAQVEKEAWERLSNLVRTALAPFSEEGVRILRSEKSPLGLILAGPASAWLRFIDQEKALVADPSLVFCQYQRPFTFPKTP
jgi:hypothetical protein